MKHVTWFDIQPDHGALEIHERGAAPGLALELHVMVHEGELWAWWQMEGGTWIVDAEIGEA